MTIPRRRPTRHFAIVGAGIAGLACARTLQRAGHVVSVFEASDTPGGRMATHESPFGSFDAGAQYFTVRDPRFELALQATAPDLARRWSANAVRVLDGEGRVVEAGLPARESHWVAAPRMNALPQRWAEPLAASGALHLGTRVLRIEADAMAPGRWQLRTQSNDDAQPVRAGFDGVLLTTTPSAVREMLPKSEQMSAFTDALKAVDIAPCWTLMLAFPKAAQPGLHSLGPQWNAARSTHHRLAWLARESSKPARAAVERWTAQASPEWSREHEQDDPQRVAAKLLKAFGEITGIRATPAYAEATLWHEAKTLNPLGRPYLWDARLGLGVGGDWCLGHRVEDAFVSGLELALAAL